MKIRIWVLLIVLLLNQQVFAQEQKTIVAFDLDETLIASDKLLKKDIQKAKDLGFDVRTSVNGQHYIIRPGAIELLDHVQSQGFEMMILTHNLYDYARDILESSGLAKYFSKLKSNEDMNKPYNVDFQTYPNHRNIKYPQRSILETYTKGLYEGLFVRGFQKMQGNTNIGPYIPCMNCAKYPPLHGARILIDNSRYNVENPLDFVGIEVKDFYGSELEEKNSEDSYLWVEELKKDIELLKNKGWIELYRIKHKKEPDQSEVKLVSYIKRSYGIFFG